jgi:DNA-binding response OmpR family regulator
MALSNAGSTCPIGGEADAVSQHRARDVGTRREGALLVVRDPAGVREIALGDATTIGRDETNDLALPDRMVSRRHATVRRTADGYVVEDHDSKNGVWVNGRRVSEPTPLHDGDELTIAARYKLYFVDADATAPLVFEGRGLRIDAETMTVYVNGQPLSPPLSGPQYELLLILYRASGHVVPRDDIVDRVWSDDEAEGVSEDAIDALIRRLRLRLSEVDPDHTYIVTVRGYGFRLDNPT